MKKLYFVVAVMLQLTVINSAQATDDCCNDECTCHWNLNNGTLTITGSGSMKDYTHSINNRKYMDTGLLKTSAPWGNTDKGNTEITNIVVSGIERIGDSAFLGATNLQNITFSDSVTEIGHNVLHSSGLSNIELPHNLKILEGGAIENMGAIKNIVLPNTLETIGNGVFGRMPLLESIVIPDSVTTIGERFAEESRNLQRVVIGDGVASIGSGAFKYGSADIYCQNTQQRSCVDLIEENNPDYVSKIKLFTKDETTGVCEVDGNYYISTGMLAKGENCASKKQCDEIALKAKNGLEFEFNGKFYASTDDLAKGAYILKRIYSVDEANLVSGKKNKVIIRYK